MADVIVKELPYPPEARKPGQSGARCFGSFDGRHSMVILYARELIADGRKAIHISISHCVDGVAAHLTPDLLQQVRDVVEHYSCYWPMKSECSRFQDGDFAGRGVHVWETPEGE